MSQHQDTPQTNKSSTVECCRPWAVLRGHTDFVQTVVFNSDGSLVVTASRDGTVRLWKAQEEEEEEPAWSCVAVLQSQSPDGVNAAAISPNDKLIAMACADLTVSLWDVPSQTRLGVLRGHTGSVLSVSFCPHGTRLATSGLDASLRLWNVASQECVETVRGSRFARFSPLDGNLVATGGAGYAVRLWDVSVVPSVLVRILRGHKNTVFGASFSPDGSRVATASRDGTTRLWSCITGACLTLLAVAPPRASHGCIQVAFSPEGSHLATIRHNEKVEVWNNLGHNNADIVANLCGHTGWVSGVAFSPDGTRIATASADETVCLWQRTHTTTTHTDNPSSLSQRSTDSFN